MTQYDDNYATCERTYATFRIYGIPPHQVTEALRVQPTEMQTASGPARPDAWVLSSKTAVESRDVRRHIDWCLDQLGSKGEALARLRADGARMDIFCYWLSASGHGGPTIAPAQAAKLAALDLDCGFDVYIVR